MNLIKLNPDRRADPRRLLALSRMSTPPDVIVGDTFTRAPEKKFPLFCQIGSTRKAAKKWLNGQKSGPTDKKVDLNGQKKYPNGTKIVRWFHYFCPLVQFWFLFQAGTFFAAFLGGPRHFFSGHLAGWRPLASRAISTLTQRWISCPPLSAMT